MHTKGDRLVVVVRDDLDEADPRRKALAIADNQTAKWADFDMPAVIEQLKSLDSSASELLAATGFDQDQLAEFLGAGNPINFSGDEDPDRAEGQIVSCPKCGFQWERGGGS